MPSRIFSSRGLATMIVVKSDISTFDPADWLSFAAAPTFAFVALLTGVLDGQPALLCLAADAAPLSGMVMMYLLMSVFHLTPWLKLIAGRRPGTRLS